MPKIALWGLLLCLTGVIGLAKNSDDEVFPVKSIVSLKADMEDGMTQNLGMGLIIDDAGHVLTNASLVYDSESGMYVDYVMMSVIDDVNMPIICFSQMDVLALDSERNLAILNPTKDTDIYCNPLEKPGRHHREFYKANHFGLIPMGKSMQCPLVSDVRTSVVLPSFPDRKKEELVFERGKILDYVLKRDDEKRLYVVGYYTDAHIYKRATGAPAFNEMGQFVGIALYQDEKNREKVAFQGIISRPVIMSWLCEMDRHSIISLEEQKGRIHQHAICQAMEEERVYR